MDFIKRFLHKIWIRTLKIDILTLFTTLTVITFSFVICYSYFKNYHAILDYSKGMMERNSTSIIQRVSNIQKETELVLNAASGLTIGAPVILVEEPDLRAFMQSIMKSNPDISAIFLGLNNGDWLLIKKMDTSLQTNFVTMPDKPLPASTTYIIKKENLKKNPPETWDYADKDFNVVGTESFQKITIEMKTRSWYLGATQTKGIFWTDVFNFLDSYGRGVAAGKAIYDMHNQFIGVLGVDISFTGLSNFLNKQTIGKFGHAFITDRNGNVIVPDAKSAVQSKIPPQVAQAAVQYFNKTQEYNFSFKYNHTRYLSYVGSTTPFFNKPWLLVTIVPFSDFFSDLIRTQFEIILITLIILILSIIVINYFSRRIAKPIVSLASEVDKLTNLDLSSHKRVFSYIVEIRMMDASIAAMRAALRSFSRYVPKEIVRQLLAQGRDITLHVDKKKLTIFFSDIKDFTTIAENNPLSTLMPLLNDYFDGISKIILENRGTIDKYIGDSVMAIWGAPLANPEHAIFSCIAALKCQAFVLEFNQKCREQGKPEFITRFGISSGTVFVGNIGTLERMNYTVIGDAVNTAARLQVTDKIYHVSIIISEQVYTQTKGRFLVRPLDTVEVKGKITKIKIYELVALLEADPAIGATEQQKELCLVFTEAYQQFVDGNYAHAKQLFEKIHQRFPDDYPTEFYLNRLTEILANL